MSKESLSQILRFVNIPHPTASVRIKRLPVLLAKFRQSLLSFRTIELPDNAPVR